MSLSLSLLRYTSLLIPSFKRANSGLFLIYSFVPFCPSTVVKTSSLLYLLHILATIIIYFILFASHMIGGTLIPLNALLIAVLYVIFIDFSQTQNIR